MQDTIEEEKTASTLSTLTKSSAEDVGVSTPEGVEEDKKVVENDKNDGTMIDRMFKVGAHFGYSRGKRHPSASPFIFGVKNNTEIIDLEKTDVLLQEAKDFVKTLGKEGKSLLFIGTKHEARSAVKEGAISIDMPYVFNRWIGGAVTNFSEIRKRINRLEDLMARKEKGEFEEKYTKKERLMLDREIDDLNSNFSGLLVMKELPKAFFIIDTKKEHTAVAEAKKIGIPIVGLLSSDSNVEDADYPIVANDSSIKSIAFFVDEIVGAYKEGVEDRLKG